MSLRFGLSAILLLAAVPAFAQPPAGGSAATPATPATPAQPSPEQIAAIQTAASTFGQCVQGGMQNVSATVTPDAGATAVLGGCAAQRQALVQSVESMIATLPAEQQAEAHAQLDSQLGQAQTQIAAAIAASRSAAAAAPATPAQPAH